MVVKKKKLALILATNPHTGGGHQYAILVAGCLVENMGADLDFIAVCGNVFWSRWCRENRVRYVEAVFPDLSKVEKVWNCIMPSILGLYNSYMTGLGKVLRKEKVDILFPLQTSFVPAYLGIKILVPVHDLMHRYEPTFPEVSADYNARELLMKSYARYADVVLVDSHLGKKQFEESYCRRGRKKVRTARLPYVVPEHIHCVEEEEMDVPAKYVFYPAQFWKHKNHINLVKAIQILKPEIEDIHLILAGAEKNCCREIKKYILENNLKDNISIAGFVSDGNITFLYKHAVGMIMPSYFGPTNIPPLEAMVLGCPVAVSDKYAMPEQVGEAGLVFNPDSPDEIAACIKKLWQDQELREKLIVLGYKRSRQWNRDKFTRKLLEVIKRM